MFINVFIKLFFCFSFYTCEPYMSLFINYYQKCITRNGRHETEENDLITKYNDLDILLNELTFVANSKTEKSTFASLYN